LKRCAFFDHVFRNRDRLSNSCLITKANSEKGVLFSITDPGLVIENRTGLEKYGDIFIQIRPKGALWIKLE
jgi:hypothetical protein